MKMLKLKNHKHFHIPFLGYNDVDIEGIRKCISAATAAPKEQTTQKIQWELQAEKFNTGCRKAQLDVMNQRAISVDFNTCASILQACADIKSLKQTHAHMLVNGLEQNIFLGTKLVSMYSILGVLVDARLVFDKILVFERTAFLWNVMIRGYVWNGFCEGALKLYYQMRGAGTQPDNFTFSIVLKACAGLSSLEEGKEIHYHIIRSRFESNAFVGAALIDMYAKCCSIENARQVFDRMSNRDVVSWNSMIAGYAQNGDSNEALIRCHQMHLTGVKPDRVTIVSVLPACADIGALQDGKQIHCYIIKNGFELNAFVGNALIDMYAKCRSIAVAYKVFNKMPKRDVVSWNAMIAGYAQSGYDIEALKLFHQMQLANVKSNAATMVSVLPACTHSAALEQGKWIHEYIIGNGLESDVAVGTALIDMYAKCGFINVAHQLFSKMSERDVVSWNAMISVHVLNGYSNEALKLFHQMQLADVKPDSATILSVLSACTDLAALKQGKWIHVYSIKNGFESDVSVGNSLVAMYSKCGSINVARRLFDKLNQRDVVSCNAMIAGYAQSGHANEALMLFHQMRLADMKPNSVTMVSVLPACSHLAALQQGRWIHQYIIRSGLESDVSVGTALIDMYAKCGSIDAAQQLFNKMANRDVVCWSTMIAGYGMHGLDHEALALFSQMQQTGIYPDYITFIGVLSACSHAGLVDEGWQYFHCMSQDYCITPRVEHYACMVDLLGRAGHLDEAENFIKKMPLEPDTGVWGALLGACRIYCNMELAERVSKHLLELEPNNAGNYVLLSNICAADGRWEDVKKVRAMLKDRGLKKSPGWSWIEIKNRVHAFLAGDRSHPQSEKIYAVLENLAGKMEEAGYVPNPEELEEKEYVSPATARS